jgi:hypothetical protein
VGRYWTIGDGKGRLGIDGLGLSPDNRVSGGKVLSVGTRKVKSRVAGALRLAVYTLSRSHSALGDYYRRMRARLGAPKAVTEAAHGDLATVGPQRVVAGNGDCAVCVLEQGLNEIAAKNIVSIYLDKIDRHFLPRHPGAGKVVGYLKEGIVERADCHQPVAGDSLNGLLHFFRTISGDYDEFLDTCTCQRIDLPADQGLSANVEQRLRYIRGQRQKPPPLAGTKDDCFHEA